LSKGSKTVPAVGAMILLAASLAGCTSEKQTNTSPSPKPSESAKASAAPSASPSAQANVYPENGLSKDPVTLKVGHWENGYGREWLDFAIKKFNAKYPNVKFEVTSSPKLDTVLSTKIAANDDNDMFDFFFPRFSGVGDTERLAEAGKFEDLSDLWKKELPGEKGKTVRSVVSDDFYDAAMLGGKTYRLPVGGYTAGLFFNENLFDKNGWNKDPKTWDEFVQLMETIKAKDVIPITFPGVYAGYLTDYTFNFLPFMLADANGSFDAYLKNFRSFKMPQFTAPEVKEAWKRMYEFGQKGYFPNGVAALNHTQSQMQVLQGKAALVSTGDWVGNEMKDSTPQDFKWGFMAIPATNDPNNTIYVHTGVTDVGYVIWKNKPDLNKKWAKEFMLSLYDFEVQQFLAEKTGVFPGRLDYGADPARLEKMQAAPKAVMAYAQRHKVKYLSLRRDVSFTSPSAAQASKTLSEAITGFASGKKDPQPVLEEVEKLYTKALEEEKK